MKLGVLVVNQVVDGTVYFEVKLKVTGSPVDSSSSEAVGSADPAVQLTFKAAGGTIVAAAFFTVNVTAIVASGAVFAPVVACNVTVPVYTPEPRLAANELAVNDTVVPAAEVGDPFVGDTISQFGTLGSTVK
jgi:hypothetical protein